MKRLAWSHHALKIVGPNPKNLMLVERDDGYFCHYPHVQEMMAEITPLGPWMAAALDDPNVCDEMKADINRFLKAIADFV